MLYLLFFLNFQSFKLFLYKISLIKCLIDRSFKIFNNWNSFHNDIENIKSNLMKNAYPPFLIEKVIKKYLDHKFSSNQNEIKDISNGCYLKLTYIGNLPHHKKNKVSKLCKGFWNENLTLSWILIHSKSKVIFQIKTQFLMIWNLS